MARFIDSHIHLDELPPGFETSGLASTADYGALIPGVTPEQSLETRARFAHRTTWWQAVAVHPWWVEETPEPPEQCARFALVEELAREPWVVAIGETGLDRLKIPLSDPLSEWVERWCIAHIELAVRVDKPLVLHSVRSHAPLADLVKRHGRGKARGVVHAFSGSLEEAQVWWKLGFCVGIGPPVTREHSRRVRAAAATIPAEQLLIETDAPAMATLDGRPGEGRCDDILDVGRTVANLRMLDEESLWELQRTNMRRLFGIG